MLFYYWDYYFTKNSIVLSFCHIWTKMRYLNILNADVYDLFYLLNRYLVAGFDLFLHKFEVLYCKGSMLCDVFVLDVYKKAVYCYSYLTCACGKLSPIQGFRFVRFTRYSILITWAFKRLPVVSRGYQKSDSESFIFWSSFSLTSGYNTLLLIIG